MELGGRDRDILLPSSIQVLLILQILLATDGGTELCGRLTMAVDWRRVQFCNCALLGACRVSRCRLTSLLCIRSLTHSCWQAEIVKSDIV